MRGGSVSQSVRCIFTPLILSSGRQNNEWTFKVASKFSEGGEFGKFWTKSIVWPPFLAARKWPGQEPLLSVCVYTVHLCHISQNASVSLFFCQFNSDLSQTLNLNIIRHYLAISGTKWHYLRLYETIWDYLWHCLTISDTIWHYLSIWHYLVLSGIIWNYSETIWDYLWHYLVLSEPIWHYLRLSETI